MKKQVQDIVKDGILQILQCKQSDIRKTNGKDIFVRDSDFIKLMTLIRDVIRPITNATTNRIQNLTNHVSEIIHKRELDMNLSKNCWRGRK